MGDLLDKLQRAPERTRWAVLVVVTTLTMSIIIAVWATLTVKKTSEVKQAFEPPQPVSVITGSARELMRSFKEGWKELINSTSNFTLPPGREVDIPQSNQ